MNVAIAEILKNYISGLNFIDKLGGLTKVIEITQDDEAKTINKVPGDYSANQHTTDKNTYQTYQPDMSKKSVIYFEGEGIALDSHESRYINLTSSLKLVAWFNLERINKTLNSATQLMLLLMNAIPKSFPNQSNILKARVIFQGQDPKSPDIFSKYNYNEAELQHLMYPCDYGALNYDIKFSIRPECIADIILNPADCLTNPNC